MPKVTFIITSYNYEKYIEQTISSIISQTYSDWELLIVDDGSTDNSVDIINKYCKKDSRIRLLFHENHENRGIIQTLLKGIANAKGEYIAFLESDDYITSNYLAKKIAIFDKYSSVGFVYNNIQTFGANPNKKVLENLLFIESYWKKHDYPHSIVKFFYTKNVIPTFSCVMLKKELINNLNWNSPKPECIDFWLWAQISQLTFFYFINEKLTYWRIHKDSYLNKSTTKPDMILRFYNGLWKFLPKTVDFNINLECLIKKIYLILKYSKGER